MPTEALEIQSPRYTVRPLQSEDFWHLRRLEDEIWGVGCPEDMVGLWHICAPWEKRKATVDYEALHDFLRKRQKDDGDLVTA